MISRTLCRLFDVESHVVAGDELFGIGQPLVQRLVGPGDLRLLECVRVLERVDRPGHAAVNTAQARAFLIAVQSVASAATLFEQLFAAASGLSRQQRRLCPPRAIRTPRRLRPRYAVWMASTRYSVPPEPDAELAEASVESTTARLCFFMTDCTLVIPNTLRSLSSATFMGPGWLAGAWSSLRKRRGHGRVERDVALRLLHDLVDVSVENRH